MEEAIKAKHLNQWNWLNHLDEMTDEEIEYMLKTAPDAKRLAEELASDPMPVRKFAEEMRDFY